MSAPAKLQALVAGVLKEEKRKGQTTKQSATLLVMSKIDRGGGGKAYGIGSAYLHLALSGIVGNVVERQLKTGLPDNVIHIAMRNAPPELVQSMGKLPAWIATGEGKDARWVPSLEASADDWFANASMKERKAKQTLKTADISVDIGRYLVQYGMNSLSDAMPCVPEAAE